MVSRYHPVGGEHQRIRRVFREEWGELAADFDECSVGGAVAEGGFGLWCGHEAEPGQPVFGGARGEKAASVLQEKAGELGDRGRVVVRDSGDSVEVVDLGCVSAPREFVADLLGHLRRAREPQVACAAAVFGVVVGEFFDEAV